MVITWKIRNIRSLFLLKGKRDYKSCDDGLYDRKVFYKKKIVFIHPL